MKLRENLRDSISSALLNNYVKIYLIDLEGDTITLLSDVEHTSPKSEVITGKYTEYVHFYCYSRLDPAQEEQIEYSEQYTSINYLREKLANYSSYSVSFHNVDGDHIRTEFIRYEMRGKVPTKVLACVQKSYAQEFEEWDYRNKIDLPRSKKKEQSQEHQDNYNRDNIYKGALYRDAVATFEINITRNMVISAFADSMNYFYPVDGVEVPGAFDIHSRYWSSRILSDNQDEFREWIKRENLIRLYERGERAPWMEYLIEGLDGQQIWLNETIDMNCDESTGDIIGVVILRDVTEKILTNLENQRRMKIIWSLTNEYETLYLVDLSTDHYSIYRHNEYILEKYHHIFTDSYEESVRKFADTVVYENDKKMFVANLTASHIEKELQNKSFFSFNFRAGTADNLRYYRSKIGRVDEREGGFKECFVAFADVEEEIRGEMRQRQLLEDALEQSRNAGRAKSEFLSNMSHDIRTPMNAIVGYTNMALNHLDDIGRVQNLLGKIMTSSNHLLQLINNALDVSRIESGRMKLDEKPQSLSEIVNNVSTMIDSQAMDKNIRYTYVIDQTLHDKVYCDRLRVIQLILNLLSNAVKYTKEGGRVVLHLRNIGMIAQNYQRMEIIVSDNGVGMSPAFMERIFEPFERENTYSDSYVTGSGLGMAICKGIVDTMGGTISVSSERGVGSTFTVRLSLRLQEQVENSNSSTQIPNTYRTSTGLDPELVQIGIFRESEDRRRTGKRRDPEGLRVLLVEDNEINREIAGELLQEFGMVIDFAENGEEALDKISGSEPGHYDLVFMDVQMPIMNGLEATRQIRALQNRRSSSVTIIAMTANAFDEDMQHAQEAGMNAYICKPLESYAIRYVLDQVL